MLLDALFLIGLFAVPAWILWYGHRLRDRTRTERGVFWGAIAGHATGALVTLGAALSTPIAWQPGQARALLVHASMLVFAVTGALVGAWVARSTGERPVR